MDFQKIFSPFMYLLSVPVQHAKITFKGGVVKYLPGRVMKCYRSSASSGAGGVYDVECEGSRLEKGLTVDSLTIGLTGKAFSQYMDETRPICTHYDCICHV